MSHRPRFHITIVFVGVFFGVEIWQAEIRLADDPMPLVGGVSGSGRGEVVMLAEQFCDSHQLERPPRSNEYVYDPTRY